MIRASIEETRRELAFSVNDLRSKVAELTDWRRQLAENRKHGADRRGGGRVRDRRRRGRHLLAARRPPAQAPLRAYSRRALGADAQDWRRPR